MCNRTEFVDSKALKKKPKMLVLLFFYLVFIFIFIFSACLGILIFISYNGHY
jgi:hypothetical protein